MILYYFKFIETREVSYEKKVEKILLFEINFDISLRGAVYLFLNQCFNSFGGVQNLIEESTFLAEGSNFVERFQNVN